MFRAAFLSFVAPGPGGVRRRTYRAEAAGLFNAIFWCKKWVRRRTPPGSGAGSYRTQKNMKFCDRCFFRSHCVCPCRGFAARRSVSALFHTFLRPMWVYSPLLSISKKSKNNKILEILALLYMNHTNASVFFLCPGCQIVAWLQGFYCRKFPPQTTSPHRGRPGTSSLACRRWSFGSGQGKSKEIM